jgi:hypothetical protein
MLRAGCDTVSQAGESNSYCPLLTVSNSSNWLSFAKGGYPHKTMYAITPIDQTSTAGPYRTDFRISGAAYPGVPHGVLRRFRLVSVTVAKPKSANLVCTLPSGSFARRRFSGFRSRCTTPFLWQ